MVTTTDLQIWVLLWVVVAGFVVLRHWHNSGGVGLLLSYVISFGVLHCMASALYLLPWYGRYSLPPVVDGMQQSAYAMVSFCVGAEIVYAVMRRRDRRATLGGDAQVPADATLDPRIGTAYVLAGLVVHVILAPIARGVPSVSALVATGSTLVVVGICLKCWDAWHRGDRRRVWFWLAASTTMPFITVATQGFLGYGMAAMMTVLAFVAVFYTPRWKVLIFASVLAYVGLSIYVTYMRDRGDIRALVWNGGSMGDRVDQVLGTVGQIEWFDIRDDRHLWRVDERLNQNFLVGSAVGHLANGFVPYAGGATIRDAVLAVVPRAIWPDKPMSAGSGDLVSIYTGITFSKETSVGVGQLMEFYINFGTAGVVLGFLILGAIMSAVDGTAVRLLRGGDAMRFAQWYIPGLSMLQLGGSFVEVTSSAAAGFVVAFMVNVIIRKLPGSRAMAAHGHAAPAEPGASAPWR